MRLLAITGYSESGKDTAANIIVGQGFKYRRLAFADRVRELALAINPFVEVHADDELLIKLNRQTERRETPRQLELPLTVIYVRLKELVNAIGWDQAKKQQDVRWLLQKTGTEGGRETLYENIWVDLAERQVDKNDEQNWNTVITDLRFPGNEDAMILRKGGLIIRVERFYTDGRPYQNRIGKEHPSEAGIHLIEPNLIWTNIDGEPEILQDQVIKTLKRLHE